MQPRPGLSARPRNPDVGAGGIAEPKVGPAELASGVTATDRELASKDALANAHLDPCPDRINVRWGLRDPHRQPATHRVRMRRVARPDGSPDPDRRAVVDLDEVEHPIEVEVGQRCPTPSVEAQDSRYVAGLAEGPVRLSEQKATRVLLRVVGLVGDVPFRDEQVDEAVVVDVIELWMPGGGWPRVAAGKWLRGVHAPLPSDVTVRWTRRTGGQCLQSIVGLACQEYVRKALAGEVVARASHPLDLSGLPPVVRAA